jgi:hypothetical protein
MVKTPQSTLGYIQEDGSKYFPKYRGTAPPSTQQAAAPTTSTSSHKSLPKKAPVTPQRKLELELEALHIENIKNACKTGNCEALLSLLTPPKHLRYGISYHTQFNRNKQFRATVKTLFTKNAEQRQALYYACLCGHDECVTLILALLVKFIAGFKKNEAKILALLYPSAKKNANKLNYSTTKKMTFVEWFELLGYYEPIFTALDFECCHISSLNLDIRTTLTRTSYRLDELLVLSSVVVAGNGCLIPIVNDFEKAGGRIEELVKRRAAAAGNRSAPSTGKLLKPRMNFSRSEVDEFYDLEEDVAEAKFLGPVYETNAYVDLDEEEVDYRTGSGVEEEENEEDWEEDFAYSDEDGDCDNCSVSTESYAMSCDFSNDGSEWDVVSHGGYKDERESLGDELKSSGSVFSYADVLKRQAKQRPVVVVVAPVTPPPSEANVEGGTEEIIKGLDAAVGKEATTIEEGNFGLYSSYCQSDFDCEYEIDEPETFHFSSVRDAHKEQRLTGNGNFVSKRGGHTTSNGRCKCSCCCGYSGAKLRGSKESRQKLGQYAAF